MPHYTPCYLQEIFGTSLRCFQTFAVLFKDIESGLKGLVRLSLGELVPNTRQRKRKRNQNDAHEKQTIQRIQGPHNRRPRQPRKNQKRLLQGSKKGGKPIVFFPEE